MEELEQTFRLYENRNQNSKGHSKIDSENQDDLIEIIHSVFDQMLSNEETVEVSHMHRLIASAVLGHDIESYPRSWPKGWSSKLGRELGFEGKAFEILRQLSPKPLEKEEIEGQQQLFYR